MARGAPAGGARLPVPGAQGAEVARRPGPAQPLRREAVLLSGARRMQRNLPSMRGMHPGATVGKELSFSVDCLPMIKFVRLWSSGKFCMSYTFLHIVVRKADQGCYLHALCRCRSASARRCRRPARARACCRS